VARSTARSAKRSLGENLAAPAGLRAVPGRGHVTLDWEPVPGAAGYLVHRADDAAGPFEPLDHGGGDVLAVPAGPYGPDPAKIRTDAPGGPWFIPK
jgi:hypothetical protein